MILSILLKETRKYMMKNQSLIKERKNKKEYGLYDALKPRLRLYSQLPLTVRPSQHS